MNQQLSSTIRNIRKVLPVFENTNSKKNKLEKASEKLATNLAALKSGISSLSPDQGIVVATEVNEFLPVFFDNLEMFDFESRKVITQIYDRILRFQVGGSSPTIDYLLLNTNLITTLIDSCQNSSIIQNVGALLRSSIEHEDLAKYLLGEQCLDVFFVYIQDTNFDIASDCFTTFRELLTKHKVLAADYLESNYVSIFEKYNELLNSDSYVTKRQSLKLLGEILLDRINFSVMTRYISERRNLKMMMRLLIDPKPTIQFEAFHVFKIFVANPNKPDPILEILIRNKQSLVLFLSEFQRENGDEQFTDEKAYLLKQIEAL
eukprot:TRINITY_DN8704_c0_g1_i1.p1 TRINITY_DN8704_c0_g1~~TRINITY_DN8704_c0_g1_i1.p1  ORF type:complete len:319 (+),score=63.76 TRINITY_DN8704_c0_g1_i1:37-993(+)